MQILLEEVKKKPKCSNRGVIITILFCGHFLLPFSKRNRKHSWNLLPHIKALGFFLSPSLFEEHFEVVYQAVRIVVNNNYLDVMYASGMQKREQEAWTDSS